MPFILVIEDDRPVREVICRTLTRAGYNVSAASDGAAALRTLEDASLEDALPDLILLDIYLPVLDGRQFVQVYRRRPEPHAPILVVTGKGYAAQRAAALDAAGSLDKPFSPKELLAKVEGLIGLPTPGHEHSSRQPTPGTADGLLGPFGGN